MDEFDPVDLEIMWSRVVNVTEEMWTTVLRTAVSTIIASANDFGCEILDAEGRSIAHAYRSMPVFNLTMPNVTKKILQQYPADSFKPGDVYITNDPWLCAGHLPDTAIVSPIFHQGRFVGFAGSIANVSDIGGTLDQKRVRESYEEGLFIPICKLYDAYEPNELVFDLFRWNVRAANMVLIDIEAQVAANEVGSRRIVDFLDEYRLVDLAGLSAAIRGRSEAAMRRAISALPDGTYRNEVETDGLMTPLKISVEITVSGDEMTFDYTGSSPQVDQGGLNCTLIYTIGHTTYPMACLLTPDVPVNEGCFAPITVKAPQASVVNCEFPASVGARVNTGWFLHGAIFGALADAVPEGIQAGNGLMSSIQTYGADDGGRVFNAHLFIGGGRGATSTGDGMGQNMFPSSASNVPVEVFEVRSPALIKSKEFVTDSGGAGKFRGAPGQRLEIGKLPGHEPPLDVFFYPKRLRFAAEGVFGGGSGSRTVVEDNGRDVSFEPEAMTRGYATVRGQSDTLALTWPGGGGYGDPRQRDRETVRRDVLNGLVSPEKARELYGMDGWH